MNVQTIAEQRHSIAPPAIVLIDPGYHCLNLAAAVNVVLYDRVVKAWANGQPLPALKQQPAFVDPLLYDRRSE